ncbi:MAG: hypothetical protein LBC50_02055 [Candidatus Ancillula sp.]|jgi:hypothetical protein|nr:hypothetical protein [Candidatus Ancillula sp.]
MFGAQNMEIDKSKIEESDQISTLTAKFFVPKGVFFGLLALIITVVGQATGLSFARFGAKWEGVHVSPDVYLSHIDFSEHIFFLVGFIPTVLFILFFLLAVFYHQISWFKYVCLAFFGVTNFLAGMAYTRLNFQNPVYVNYHYRQAYKVNAINVGIISVLFIACIIMLTVIILLILRNRTSLQIKVYTKANCIAYLGALSLIMVFVAWFTPLLEYFSATAPQI